MESFPNNPIKVGNLTESSHGVVKNYANLAGSPLGVVVHLSKLVESPLEATSNFPIS